MLRDRCHPGGQATRQARQHQLNRSRALIGCGELFGVVCVDRVRTRACLLLAKAEESFDGRAGVRAPDPLAGRTPLELSGFGHGLQGLTGTQQGFDIHAVVDGLEFSHHVHCFNPSFC